MAIGDVLAPTGEIFGGALGKAASYAWVLWIFVPLFLVVAGIFLYLMLRKKKKQWTHTLEIQRVLQNNLLSDKTIIKMRRFPLIKNAEVFELEKPLLGGYLLPEPGKYSGVNTYSIVLDDNNRIWRKDFEYFKPNESSSEVSARHAEIDLQHSTLKADWQNINKIGKKVDWMQIAKYAMWTILVLAVMVVLIVGLGEWGDAQANHAEAERARAAASASLAESLDTNLETANTNVLILDLLKDLYKTENIPGVINNVKNQTA